MQQNTQDNQTTTITVEFAGHTFRVTVPVKVQVDVLGEDGAGAKGGRPRPPLEGEPLGPLSRFIVA